jgi:tRNA threonylcarbamoyladenosine biosynthesis protein TsaB
LAIILHIETSTQVCSVAVSKDGVLQSLQESTAKNSHAELITLFSEKAVREAGLLLDDLDAVAVSMGPGSYTGLRIGVSTAKGFCFALNKPLISLGTLEAMASGMVTCLAGQNQLKPDLLYCPMIDARRMEVYTAIYDEKLHCVQDVSAKIIDESSFTGLLATHCLVFAGDGAQKCKPLLSSAENARFIDEFSVSARFMIPLAEEKFALNQFEDVAYFEPFYLKDFVGGIPQVKGLR